MPKILDTENKYLNQERKLIHRLKRRDNNTITLEKDSKKRFMIILISRTIRSYITIDLYDLCSHPGIPSNLQSKKKKLLSSMTP